MGFHSRLCWNCDGQERRLLHFEDHPSILHTDTGGTLEIDEEAVAMLNVDSTFFVTVAIAYLGFLEDQEVSSKSHSSGFLPCNNNNNNMN